MRTRPLWFGSRGCHNVSSQQWNRHGCRCSEFMTIAPFASVVTYVWRCPVSWLGNPTFRWRRFVRLTERISTTAGLVRPPHRLSGRCRLSGNLAGAECRLLSSRAKCFSANTAVHTRVEDWWGVPCPHYLRIFTDFQLRQRTRKYRWSENDTKDYIAMHTDE